MDVYFPTGQVDEAYCQSYNGVVQNQEPACIRIAQSKPRSQANQESGPRLKNCCLWSPSLSLNNVAKNIRQKYQNPVVQSWQKHILEDLQL